MDGPSQAAECKEPRRGAVPSWVRPRPSLLETKLRSYEKEKTSFAPALEETQWEVRLYRVGLGWSGV